MTKIQQFLADLPEEKKSLFVPVSGAWRNLYGSLLDRPE